MEAIDQIRSGGHRLKPRLRSSNPHIERRAAVWFHAGKHDLALVQSGQRLSDPLRCVPDGSDAATMSEVLAQVHPWVEVVEHKARLDRGPCYWSWNTDAL